MKKILSAIVILLATAPASVSHTIAAPAQAVQGTVPQDAPAQAAQGTVPQDAANSALIDAATAAKRESRRNLVVKEWNTDARTKTRWLDRVTVYDSEGRKTEETEYAQYGQKWRETYEYGPNDKIVKEVYYDDRNKPVLIRKYEYDSKNRKIRQYNYAPNGKLQTTKVFEYIIEAR